MALTLQQLRSTATGVEPLSLLPGQIAFNTFDKVIYVGDGTDFKTSFDGTTVAGVSGNGWYSMPMDFSLLNNYYIVNPEFYGDIPTDQQVLTWSDALNHPIWTSNIGGDNQVYVITNNDVAIAPGATTSAKITAAIGVVSPDEGDVTIVTGLPDEVYEGLYFFTTGWVKGAAYAYPSASEVIYNNTAHPSLTATVQGAIDDLDDGLIATTAIANTANSTANSALSIASAALPRAGGTMTGPLRLNSTLLDGAGSPGAVNQVLVSTLTGVQWVSNAPGDVTGVTGTAPITVDNTDPQNPVVGVSNATTSSTGVVQLNNTTASTSTTEAATANSVKVTKDVADAALPKAGGTMSGDITIDAALIDGVGSPGTNGYVLESTGTGIQWVANAPGDVTGVTGTAPITVDNTDPQTPVVGISAASTSAPGAVQLNNTTASTSTTEALTAAQGKNLQDQIDALVISSNLTLAGTLNATTGNLVTVTTEGTAEGFAIGSPLPSPAAGNAEFFVIATVGATSYTPPGGSPVLVHVGDWFLSSGTVWNFLDISFQAPSASTTVEGVVYLATDAEVQAGTDVSNKVINPASLQSKLSDSVSTVSSTAIASSTAVKTAYDKGAQALTAAGVAQATANAAIPGTAFTAAGDLLVGTSSGNYIALADGSVNQILITNGAGILSWANNTVDGVQGVTGISPVIVDNVDPANPVISINAAGAATYGVVYGLTQNNVSGYNVSLGFGANGTLTTGIGNVAIGGASGDITSGSYNIAIGFDVNVADPTADRQLAIGPDAYTRWLSGDSLMNIKPGAGLRDAANSLGTAGQILSSTGTTLQWATPAVTPAATPTVAGIVLGCTTATISALGCNALFSNTTGTYNTATGNAALLSNTTGIQNTATGSAALYSNTSGNNNTATGGGALFFNTTGCYNTANGLQALFSNTTGCYNTANGASALCSNTTGNNNTANGTSALRSNTTGNSNTATGNTALFSNTTGCQNTAIGYNSGCLITSGCLNTAIGTAVQVASPTGSCQLAIGFSATDNWLIGDSTKAIKPGAGIIDCAASCGTAGQVLMSNGSNAVCWGTPAVTPAATPTVAGIVLGCTTGTNSALGCNALLSNTSGIRNTTTGSNALRSNTTGGANTANGFCALNNNTTGCCNTAIGICALRSNTTGSQNTANGVLALSANTTGNYNTAIGYNSGCLISSGCLNTAIGTAVQVASPTGSCQLAIGFSATDNWLIGTSTKAIKPGAGVIDCTNSCGTAGQVLMSNGSNAVCWATPAVTPAATPIVAGIVLGCTTANISALGCNALVSNTTGVYNTATGIQALRSNTTGGFNTATGTYALCSNTTGCFNTANGANTLCSNTTGTQNTAYGFLTLCSNTTGNCNTATGYIALVSNTTGSNNTATGNTALRYNTTGCSNTANGVFSLFSNTTGCFNTANGARALLSNTTGCSNTAYGGCALSANTTGCFNTVIGYTAGCLISSGCFNTAIGNAVQVASATGSCQLAIGFSATNNWLTGTSTKAIKPGAGVIDCANSCGTAGQVLMSNGSNAVCWGTTAVTPAATPIVAGIVLGCTTANISALGCNALVSNTTGVYNTATGLNALRSNTTGCFNTATGTYALCSNTTGCFNTANGANTLCSNTTGTQNTAYGFLTLCSNTTGNCNTATGYIALVSNTTGSNNTATGNTALRYNTTGCSNTANGVFSLFSNTTGCFNTANGARALLSNTTGCSNTAIGYLAGCLISSGCLNTAIGSNVQVASATGSCQLAIGFSSTQNWLTGDSAMNVKLGAGLRDSANSLGSSGQILSSTGTALQWVNNTVDGVQGVTGTAPITVDNTNPANPIVGINASTTTQVGAVQLQDSVSSTSITTAATPNSVKTSYDLAVSALPKSGGTMTGDITFNATQSFPVSGIADATTSTKGVVQLNNTTASTSTTEALTANQGRNLQEQINALAVSSNLILAGTLNASTGFLVTVTTEGTAQGFSVGSVLPSPAAGNSGFFVIATVGAASYTPPGGSATTVNVGDWFLSSGTVWNFLDVGFQVPSASTTVEGVVYLATDAEVQAGVETTHATTPSGLQSKVSDSVSTVSSTAIASSTAVKTAYDLADAAMPKTGGSFTGNVTFEEHTIFDGPVSFGGGTVIVGSDAAWVFDDGNVVTWTAASTAEVNGSWTFNSSPTFNDGLTVAGGLANFNSYVNFTSYNVFLDGSQTFVDVGSTFEFVSGSTTTVGNSWTFNTTPIYGASANVGPALKVTYDNTTSGLTATDVQGAIDEIANTTVSKTATKAVTNATPVSLLSWASGVRMGNLTVMATDNSTNVVWANITIGSPSGIGSSVVVSQAGTFGTFAVIAGGSGETIVRFTPSSTLAAVNFVYKYTVSFGTQPTIL